MFLQIGKVAKQASLCDDQLASSTAEARDEICYALFGAGLRCHFSVLHAVATHMATERLTGQYRSISLSSNLRQN